MLDILADRFLNYNEDISSEDNLSSSISIECILDDLSESSTDTEIDPDTLSDAYCPQAEPSPCISLSQADTHLTDLMTVLERLPISSLSYDGHHDINISLAIQSLKDLHGGFQQRIRSGRKQTTPSGWLKSPVPSADH